MPSMQDLGLDARLLKALDQLEFHEPTDVQAAAIPEALAGHDLMVCARTGGGKTAAFILPMLERFLAEDKPRSSTRGLILLPTRELALQTQKAFEALARFTYIKCGLVIGGEAFKHQVADIRKNPEVLIATPGRLVEHIEKGTVDFSDIEVLVLDEADHMLDMGFAEDMHTIASRCPTDKQTLLFSATLKHIGISNVSQNMRSPKRLEIDAITEGHSQITQERILADDDKHKTDLVVALVEQEAPKRAMVFCKTREQCQSVSNVLRYKKLNARYIHGELSQSERKQVLNQFRDGKLQVIVCTDVAARGLDIADVDLVINFTAAQSGDDHVHRVGRTGRQDATGKAVTLVNRLDWNLMSSIERYLKIRLTPRKIAGLEAKYTGPKKVKASGKAAGTKKRKDTSAKGKKPANKKPSKNTAQGKAPAKRTDNKQSSGEQSQKPTPRRSTGNGESPMKKASPRRNTMSTAGDGSAPLKRKR